MNATTASGRKRIRAASDRAGADGNAETDRSDIGPRPRVSAPAYPEMPTSRNHHHHQHQQQHVQRVVTSTAVAAAQLSVKEKQRLCTNCKNHGLRKVWKKHKRYCKYRDCPCLKCMKTAATRKNCAEQTAKRRARQEDEQREQELQLNPANFQDERAIPYQSDATTPQSYSRQNMSESSQVGRSSTPKGTISPRTSDFEDHNSSSIDIGDGYDGIVGDGDGMVVERDDDVNDRSLLASGVGKKDIDADSRPDSHEELKYLDMRTEKSEAIASSTTSTESKTVVVLSTHQQQVHHDRQSVSRLPTSALIGHHHNHHHQHTPSQPPPTQHPPPPSHHQPVQLPHNQQPQLHHNRSGSSLSMIDYREPVTAPMVIALESGVGAVGGGGRRPAANGSVSNVLCTGPSHPPHMAVHHPRPMYPVVFPLPNTTTLWHHAQPHFPTASITFQPFIDVPPNEWSRNRRLPMLFNPDPQPEPVNLQQNNHHHCRPELSRALEIAERLQQERAAHSRPAPANPPAHDDREQTRHHA